MPIVRLPGRGVVSVAGREARALLDRLVTCDMDPVSPGTARFGALLSPQGKVLADFLVFGPGGVDEEAFLLDVPATCAADLVKRLNLYRLRARVDICDRSGELDIIAGWQEALTPKGAIVAAPDPRWAALGWRAVFAADGNSPAGPDGEAAYHAHRIALGVPEAGLDFPLGEAFPHEALMDQLGGVDFGKGCYVGQEVVSRMQHRGTARTRIVSVRYEGEGAAPGTEVTAGERVLGRTGTASVGRGFAMMRLDRTAEALAAGMPVLADGRSVRFEKPDWVRFPYPGEIGAAVA